MKDARAARVLDHEPENVVPSGTVIQANHPKCVDFNTKSSLDVTSSAQVGRTREISTRAQTTCSHTRRPTSTAISPRRSSRWILVAASSPGDSQRYSENRREHRFRAIAYRRRAAAQLWCSTTWNASYTTHRVDAGVADLFLCLLFDLTAPTSNLATVKNPITQEIGICAPKCSDCSVENAMMCACKD